MTGHKPLSDTTLYYMRKVDLIKYIRTLEHNLMDADERLERQAQIMEKTGVEPVEENDD